MSLVLHGYRYSVYIRIARLALAEKGVAYDRVEVNPFAPDVPAAYLALHPFGRVPTLVHDGFALYETGAITRYIDRAFPGPALQPTDAAGAGPDGPDHRHRRFLRLLADGPAGLLARACSGRALGQPADEAEIARGLAASAKVLAALEPLVGRRSARLPGRPASRRDDGLLRAGARRARRCCSDTPARRMVGRGFRRGRASPPPIPACRRRHEELMAPG